MLDFVGKEFPSPGNRLDSPGNARGGGRTEDTSSTNTTN